MQNFGRFFAPSDFDCEYLRNGLRYPNQKGRFLYRFLLHSRKQIPKKLYPLKNFGRFWTTSDFDREYLRNGFRYPKSAGVTNYGNSCCV